MTIDEFNRARDAIHYDLRAAVGNPTPEILSELAIRMALHGLVAVPFDHYPDGIPQPICVMIFVPTTDRPESQAANSYLVPADQFT
jgi:hypothetical protein